jgi:hypothetical protein
MNGSAKNTGSLYAELQVTSHFSFLRGASSCEELFAQAAYLGIEALAITDRNSLAGIVRAYEASKTTCVRMTPANFLHHFRTLKHTTSPRNSGVWRGGSSRPASFSIHSAPKPGRTPGFMPFRRLS